MCGIMGYVRMKKNIDFAKLKRVLKCVHVASQERGTHSSGIAVQSRGYIKAFKSNVPAKKLVKRPLYNEYLQGIELFIGHTRWATHGSAAKNINNHPHWNKNMRYVLVHNGTILDLPPKEIDPMLKGECDSEILLRMIEKYGIDSAAEQFGQFSHSNYSIFCIGSCYLCMDFREI